MTDRARELLERVLAGMDRYGDIYPETLEEIRAYLAEPEVKRDDGKTALQHYKECCLEGEDEDPIERLRFFCSIAMKGQDWLDVELFFDALHPAPRPEFMRLSEEEVSQILSSAHTPYEAVCATENRLVEKNK